MDKISPELVERMVEVIRFYVGSPDAQDAFQKRTGRSVYGEMLDIAQNLPKSVDPDLIEARNIVAECRAWFDADESVEMAERFRNGVKDEPQAYLVPFALAAIKRGRELAGGAA